MTKLENCLAEKPADAMQPFVSEEADKVGESMRGDRHWFCPAEALREAIVNALAHRDWTRHEEIEIVQHSGRLEIPNPGTPQNSMIVEKMIAGQRSARNLPIVEPLRCYAYVDARGMEVRNKIVPLLRERNKSEPEFNATEDHLRLVMHAAPRNPKSRRRREPAR